MQRVLNSTGEVCVFGEPHFMIDDLMALKRSTESFSAKSREEVRFDEFKKSCRENSFDQWIPNAFRNPFFVSVFIDLFLFILLRPLGKRKRSGFKEIRIKSMLTLEMLEKTFPESYFIFLFRNPEDQLVSILSYHKRSINEECNVIKPSPETFSAEYLKYTEIFLRYSEGKANCFHVFDGDILDTSFLNNLLKALAIESGFDEALLRNRVRGLSDPPKEPLSEADHRILKEHGLDACFSRLMNRAKKDCLRLGNHSDANSEVHVKR
ncbi:MAG: hypothetical protein GVY36_06010 [Verrucomicrobia bacterium]|nr:hypothetical protein [Verrucomicrobiota bacterium]